MLKIQRFFKDHLLLSSILTVAAVLRLYHCDFQSVWVDEINTMVQSKPDQSLKDTYKSLLSYDLQPPLYFYLLKYLFRIFGYTTLVMRVFSALLGTAGVWAIYLLGRELVDRRTGIFAAGLLCVNYYHIHYSQEGRPYAFLVLFVCLSFYCQSVFLRDKSRKNTIFAGLSSALMLYGHPIALFALLAQMLVFTWHFVMERSERLLLFKRGLLMAAVLTLVYIPALPLLYSASSVKSFWIETPWQGIFAFILSQFFGASETVLAHVYLLMILFFVAVLGDKFLAGKTEKASLTDPNFQFQRAFLVLIPWLLCCILIPLVRSYLSVPMIIPRYMNIILPAVILIIAIPLSAIGSRFARYALAASFVLFSMTDLLVVKDYYNRPTKTDFRGVTNYVMKRVKPDDQLVSRIGWHYSYMFENTEPKYPVLWNSFQAYVETAIKWPQNFRHGFWFLDAQSAPLDLTPEASDYLYRHYVIDYKKDLYQAVGIHYIYKDSSFTRLDFPARPEISAGAGGSVVMVPNDGLKTGEVSLTPGRYELLLSAGGQTGPLLNGIGSHLTVKMNDRPIGGVFLNADETICAKRLFFHLSSITTCKFEITFDNAFSDGNKERKATLFAAHAIRRGNAENATGPVR